MRGEDGAWLLHFFDRGYAPWRARVDRIGGRSFGGRLTRSIGRIRTESPDPEADLLGLYEHLQRFNPKRLGRLRKAGGCLAPKIDLDAIARKHFGENLG